MTITIETPGTLSINEAGDIKLEFWSFNANGAYHTVSDFCGAALEYSLERFKNERVQKITDDGSNTVNGVTGLVPEHMLK